MSRRVVSYFIIISFTVLLMFNFKVFAQSEANENSFEDTVEVNSASAFELKSKSAILVDTIGGNILYEKNIHEKLPIASVTKIMSMLLVMEAIDSGKLTMNDMVEVSENAYSMGGSQVYLKPGEEFTVRDMLKAVSIHSANDATVALAEKTAGSEEIFVNMMNEKAKELGMENTNFLDTTGLTDVGNYSTAYDITLMSRELMIKHPSVLEFTSKWMDKFREGEEAEIGLVNRNKLVRFYDGANGLKTGFTNKAGHCISASATRNDLSLIAVVLAGPDSNTRFSEARKLLDYGFANYEKCKLESKGDEVGKIAVKKGLVSEIKAIYAKDAVFLTTKGIKSKIEKIINIPENVTAPIKNGQKIGEAIYYIDGKEIGKIELISDTEVEKAVFKRLIFCMILEWFSLGRK